MMKKKYFLGAMAAFGLLAFSSCSSDDDPITGGEQELTGEQVIVLDMQDTDVLSTKSRPLLSTTNQGAEEVTDVKLLVFKVEEGKPSTFLKEINIPSWDQISKDYNYGRKYSIRLTGGDKIKIGGDDSEIAANGKIAIVAVGQNEKKSAINPFTWATDKKLSDIWNDLADKTWNAAAGAGQGFAPLFTNAVGTNGMARVSEIFSGTSETTPIQLDGGFEAKVLLKRQVAGVLGYFSHIPAKVTTDKETHVKYVRLVASQRNTQLDLTSSLGDQVDDATGAGKTEKVVNGFTGDQKATADGIYSGTPGNIGLNAFTVYQIDLSKWFTGWEDATGWNAESIDKDGLLKAEKWVNGLDAVNKKPVVAAGAVLAGEFVIPFSRNTQHSSFELQLLDKDNNLLKSWNVKLDVLSQDPATEDGELVYNIYRNHLYQIGQRGSGDSPTNPGTDPDKPQPLNKDQDLVIKINDQWEFIHDMEIE